MTETFKTFKKSQFAVSSNNTITATSANEWRRSGKWHTAYGSVLVSCIANKKYLWKFKIGQKQWSGYGITIGIDEGNCKWIEKDFLFQNSTSNYGYSGNGRIYDNGKGSHYSNSFGNGDTVQMQLDMQQMTIRWRLTKGSKKALKWSNKIKIKPSDIGYKMCVSMKYDKDCLTLLSFGTIDIKTINDDEKQDMNVNNKPCKSCKQYELTIISLQENLESVKEDNNEILCKTLSKNDTLNGQIKELKTQMDEQQARIKSLESRNESLRNERDTIQCKLKQFEKENIKLQADNGQLMDDQKELEIRNQNLEEEVKKLKAKCIDTSRYFEWNDEEIVNWIMSLEDGRYSEYEERLRQQFAIEEMKGEYLAEITETNLKDWGIVNFRDRKDLFKAIQNLTTQKIEINKQPESEGQSHAPTAYL